MAGVNVHDSLLFVKLPSFFTVLGPPKVLDEAVTTYCVYAYVYIYTIYIYMYIYIIHICAYLSVRECVMSV